MPLHLGHPSILGMGTAWCCPLKVVLGVVSIPDHPFSLIVGLVVASVRARSSLPFVGPMLVLVLDCPSSWFVGPDSSRFMAILVTSCLILLSACALNRRPLVLPKCRDYFGSLKGHCVRRLTLSQMRKMLPSPRRMWLGFAVSIMCHANCSDCGLCLNVVGFATIR